MAQVNLLYRRQADLAESAEERAALLKKALIDKIEGPNRNGRPPGK
jgi:hypothetical protein